MAEGSRYFAKMADRLTESSGNRATSGPKKQEIFVKEELKIAVKFTLDKFRYDEEQKGIILSDFAMFALKKSTFFFGRMNACPVLFASGVKLQQRNITIKKRFRYIEI